MKPPYGSVTLPAPVTKVDEELGDDTEPVPAAPLPPVVPVLELEKPPPLLF